VCRPISVTKHPLSVVAASFIRGLTRPELLSTAVVKAHVGTSGASGRSLSTVWGTCATRRRPSRARATREVAKAVLVAADDGQAGGHTATRRSLSTP
jgi:hypothetical protein